MIELLKVVVQPVAIERDPDGKILGERLGEATAIYDLDKVQAFVDELRAGLAREQEVANAVGEG